MNFSGEEKMGKKCEYSKQNIWGETVYTHTNKHYKDRENVTQNCNRKGCTQDLVPTKLCLKIIQMIKGF